jgi:hypothetical protein
MFFFLSFKTVVKKKLPKKYKAKEFYFLRLPIFNFIIVIEMSDIMLFSIHTYKLFRLVQK